MTEETTPRRQMAPSCFQLVSPGLVFVWLGGKGRFCLHQAWWDPLFHFPREEEDPSLPGIEGITGSAVKHKAHPHKHIDELQRDRENYAAPGKKQRRVWALFLAWSRRSFPPETRGASPARRLSGPGSSPRPGGDLSTERPSSGNFASLV